MYSDKDFHAVFPSNNIGSKFTINGRATTVSTLTEMNSGFNIMNLHKQQTKNNSIHNSNGLPRTLQSQAQ